MQKYAFKYDGGFLKDLVGKGLLPIKLKLKAEHFAVLIETLEQGLPATVLPHLKKKREKKKMCRFSKLWNELIIPAAEMNR